MILDTHVHAWQISRFDYRWIKPDTPLHQDYLPHEVQSAMQTVGVEGCILVEAHNSLEETMWLLELAEQHDFIKGVVGWADFEQPMDALSQLVNNPYYTGVRMSWFAPKADIQAIAERMSTLAALGLSCDILLNQDSLEQVQQVISRNPQVTYILNHMIDARYTREDYPQWRDCLISIAPLSNVYVKFSGFLTARGEATPLPTIERYFVTALEFIGAERLMFGSDWPVCTRYGQTYSSTIAILNALTTDVQILRTSAQRIYGE